MYGSFIITSAMSAARCMYIGVMHIHTLIYVYVYIWIHINISICIYTYRYINVWFIQHYRVAKTHRMPPLAGHFSQKSH